MESESDSVASEDDAGKKEEMKRSIFMKRKSDEVPTTAAAPAAAPAAAAKPPEFSHRKISNPFTFKDTKKIAQEILNRKKEEMNVQTPKEWTIVLLTPSSVPSRAVLL
jgi:hypothetical protein